MTDVQAEAGPSTAISAGSAPAPTTKATTIPIRLISRSDSHAIPASKYMVPSDWRRFQLSELINKVLGNEQAVPFDFIVEDELLRTSLGGFTEAKGLTEVGGGRAMAASPACACRPGMLTWHAKLW